jgi:hypothetical protein
MLHQVTDEADQVKESKKENAVRNDAVEKRQ